MQSREENKIRIKLIITFWIYKLQVQMVKMAELRQHLPRDCLPQHLGGLLPLDTYSWNQQLLAGQNGRVDPVDELVGIPLEDTSIHVPGPESMRPQELLAHLGRLQRSGIHQEYEELRREPPPGTFHCAQWVYLKILGLALIALNLFYSYGIITQKTYIRHIINLAKVNSLGNKVICNLFSFKGRLS